MLLLVSKLVEELRGIVKVFGEGPGLGCGRGNQRLARAHPSKSPPARRALTPLGLADRVIGALLFLPRLNPLH